MQDANAATREATPSAPGKGKKGRGKGKRDRSRTPGAPGKGKGKGKDGKDRPSSIGAGTRKDEPCFRWAQTGKCEYGKNCAFAHGNIPSAAAKAAAKSKAAAAGLVVCP